MSSRNQRIAKRRGFTNKFRVQYDVVNLERLEGRFESGAVVDVDALKSAGLIRDNASNVKVLGDGNLAAAIHLVGVKVSASARQKIEAAGGSVALENGMTSPVAATEGESGDTGSI
jgi:large subunit ribosomal protein L15